jgi:hypothetical protein
MAIRVWRAPLPRMFAAATAVVAHLPVVCLRERLDPSRCAGRAHAQLAAVPSLHADAAHQE